MSVRLVSLLILSLLAGCAVSAPSAPMSRFLAGDIDETRAFFDRQLRTGDTRSGALYLNGLAEMELLTGDTSRARRHFLQAGSIMGNWATSGGEVFGAIVGDEGSKTWRGDPHEKIMNAFYAGLLYWLADEPDNARACFRKGLIADAASEADGSQTDSALLYWLSGRMSLAMGRIDEAETVFGEAVDARAFAVAHGAVGGARNRVLEDPSRGNLTCLFSIGEGPTKYRTGPYGAISAIRSNPGAASAAEVILDGQSLGASSILLDLDYQARTRGGRAIEGIREGKAIFKDAATISGAIVLDRALSGSNSNRGESVAVGVGLLALGFLINPSADVRHWQTLPRSVQVLVAEVEPGEHELEIRYVDTAGRVLSSRTQRWLVEVPPDGEGVYHFRDLPGLDRLDPPSTAEPASPELVQEQY